MLIMGRIVAYLRVSSRAQDAASQRAAIEQIAGKGAIAEWYSEKRSGKTLDRVELQRLRADVRAGRVSKVYVFRLDRLARSGIRDTLEVVDELRAHGCELVSISDGFTLAGPTGDVVLAVMAWAAQMERLAINERIASARERLASEGKPWGRPNRMTAAEVTEARAMRDAGRSVREVAMAMKVPKSTVARALA